MAKVFSIFKYILVIAVMAAIVFAAAFFSNKNKKEYIPPTPSVSVARPVGRTIADKISFSAHIEARSMVAVIPLVSGTIVEYPAKAGDLVKKDSVLAVIDEKPLRQQMLQAKAAYTGYESSFKRVAGLYKAGSVSRQEYESVLAQRDASRAQYELAQLQLGYAKVTAPVSGTILSAPLAVGNVGSSNQPVAVIADLDDLVIRLQVPEKYFSLFAKNSKALYAEVLREVEGVESKVSIESCNAVVDSIAPYVDATAKTFETVFKLVDKPETFRPGMYARIIVTFREYENAPALPITARKTDGSCYILVDDHAEHVMFSDVVSDGEWFMVPKNYADKLFLVEGQGVVFNGQQVSAMEISLPSNDK